jgi:hypothetical protein
MISPIKKNVLQKANQEKILVHQKGQEIKRFCQELKVEP